MWENEKLDFDYGIMKNTKLLDSEGEVLALMNKDIKAEVCLDQEEVLVRKLSQMKTVKVEKQTGVVNGFGENVGKIEGSVESHLT